MNIENIGTGAPDYNPGPARVQAYADNNGLSPDDLAALMQDGADQLRGYHIGRDMEQLNNGRWQEAPDVNERRALEVAQCAHAAVCDTALVCRTASLDGTEVKNALRDASQALLRLIALIEGKT